MHKKQPNIIIINPDQWRREKVKNNTRIENRIFITIILPPTTRNVERLFYINHFKFRDKINTLENIWHSLFCKS
jgi:hypothetical protein